MTFRRLFGRPKAELPTEKPREKIATVLATYGPHAITGIISSPELPPPPSSTHSTTPPPGDDQERNDSEDSSNHADSLDSFLDDYTNEFGPLMVSHACHYPEIRDRIRQVLLRRRDLAFSIDAVREAARLWDREMMAFLLETQRSEVHLTCGVVEAAVANEMFGLEVLGLFQEHATAVKITRRLVDAADENKSRGREILLHLLSDSSVSITTGGVEAIVGAFDLEVVEVLLRRPASRIRVTAGALVAAAGNPQGLQILETLFEHTREVPGMEDLAVATARNEKAGWQILQFLIDKGLDIPATEMVWSAAARHEKHGRRIVGLLFGHQGKVIASEAVIVAAASNSGTGKLVLDFLLERESNIVLKEVMIMAAIGNRRNPGEIIDALLLKSNNELRLTEQIVPGLCEDPAEDIPWMEAVRSDTSNALYYILNGEHKDRVSFTSDALVEIMRRGTKEVICELLDTLGEKICISEAMIEAAAENQRTRRIMQRLFEHTPSVKVTPKAVLLAASQKHSATDLLKVLFNHTPSVQVPPEAIEAAAGNHFWAREMVEALLEQTPTVLITEKAIAAAGQDMYDRGTFDAFLSKCKGEVRLSLQGLPYMIRDIATGPTIDFVKRALAGPHDAKLVGPPLEEAVRLSDSEVVALILKNGKSARALSIREAEGVVGNSYAGKAILEMLLDQGFKLELTESVVHCASGIFDNGYEVLDLLLRNTESVRLLQSGAEAIAALLPAQLVRLMFETRDVQFTTRIVEGAARNSREVLSVLVEALGEFPPMTDSILQAAGANPNSLRWIYSNYGDDVQVTQRAVEIATTSSTALELMLDNWGDQIQITTRVMEAIATSYSVSETVIMLFEMYPDSVFLGEDFWTALVGGEYQWRAEEAVEALSEYCDYIPITDALVTAASKHGKSLLRVLLSNMKAHVTPSGVDAIARSFDREMVMLLHNRHGHYIHFTERTMEAAAENEARGWEVIEFLIRTRSEQEPECDDWVIEAAARNPRQGKDIMDLLEYRFPDTHFASESVLLAAATNPDKEGTVIKFLLDQWEDEVLVTPAVIDAAIANSLPEDVIPHLLDHVNDPSDRAAVTRKHGYSPRVMMMTESNSSLEADRRLSAL
ncbi:hypothetical protein BJY04DRAFT_219119 [Aspergillus karnatakaensis]|uniref:uncharacterized protein n=1 Tax=Aspergillus karnatakaensis TaxID=1810916 RepID=UPI003CCD13AD